MQIVGTNGIANLYFIPRDYNIDGNEVKIILTSESTNKPIEILITGILFKNYIYFSAQFGTLVEGQFYNLQIIFNNTPIYRDRVFCTDQNINQTNNNYYSINDGQYVNEESYDNEYIII